MANGKMIDLALAQARAASLKPAPADGIGFSFGFQTTVEPNAAAKARILAQIESMKLSGLEPPSEFDLGPEDQDVVIYKQFIVSTNKTPGGIAFPGGQVANVALQGEEFARMPMAALLGRANDKLRERFGG